MPFTVDKWYLDLATAEGAALTSADGTIEWHCLIPRARATIVTPTARYDGLGYVEHLRLTLPPWAFPFHTLRWGRHLSERHGLVWIAWDGATPMRVAWLDGEVQPAAQVTATGVSDLSTGRALQWHDSRDLCHRQVGAAVSQVAPALGALVAGRLARMQEHKQLSASALVDAAGTALDAGWTIHEVVTW